MHSFSQLLEEFVDAQQVPCLRCFLVMLNVHNINFNLPDSEAATMTALETFPWKGHLLIVGFPSINIIPSNKYASFLHIAFGLDLFQCDILSLSKLHDFVFTFNFASLIHI